MWAAIASVAGLLGSLVMKLLPGKKSVQEKSEKRQDTLIKNHEKSVKAKRPQ